ncbi:MAG: hypothetical protein ABL984_05790 [Pyrinomonadaceae bacterium]
MQNRSGRLILNSIYSLLAWLLPVALGLLVTPLLLKRLGLEAYGVYLVILGFIGYSYTFNVSRAVAKFVAEFKASGETQKINPAITAAFCISLTSGILGSLVIALLANWAVKDLLQISTEFQRPATVALMIGGASIPFILIGQVFQNILQGTHRFAALSIITNLNWSMLNAGNVLLVVLGFGIDSLILWTVVVAASVAAISYVAARRSEPDYRLEFGSAELMLRPVAAYGSSIFMYQIFGSLMLIFERAWVTRHFGAETAAYYLVPMALGLYFHGFMSNLTAAIFPVFNELIADRERLLELYKKSTKLIVSFSVLFLISMFFGGKIFLGLWIDPQFAEKSYRLLLIHAFTFGLMAAVIAVWQINEVFRAARLNALLAGLWAFITIALMAVASGQWGAEGVAASRLIGVAVTLPAIFLIEKRFLGGTPWRFWGGVALRIFAAALALSLVEYFIFAWLGIGGWIGLMLGWAFGALVYLLVLALAGFVSKDEKAAVLKLLGLDRASVH